MNAHDTYVPDLPVNAPSEAMVAVGLPLEYAHAAEATRLFADLLATENAALREHAIDKVIAMQDRKRALVRLYEDRLHVLASRPDLGGILPDQWREDMGALAGRLASAAEENARLLKARMATIEMILKNVADAVAAAKPKDAFYGKDGVLGTKTVGETLSVSINTTI